MIYLEGGNINDREGSPSVAKAKRLGDHRRLKTPSGNQPTKAGNKNSHTETQEGHSYRNATQYPKKRWVEINPASPKDKDNDINKI